MQTTLHAPCQPIPGVHLPATGDDGRQTPVTPTAGQRLASLVIEIDDARVVREDHAYYRSWSRDLETYLDGAYTRLMARDVAPAIVRAVVAQLEATPAARRAA